MPLSSRSTIEKATDARTQSSKQTNSHRNHTSKRKCLTQRHREIDVRVEIQIFGDIHHIFLLLILFLYAVEKLADEPEQVVKKPVVVANINKWEGEDEDDVKVS